MNIALLNIANMDRYTVDFETSKKMSKSGSFSMSYPVRWIESAKILIGLTLLKAMLSIKSKAMSKSMNGKPERERMEKYAEISHMADRMEDSLNSFAKFSDDKRRRIPMYYSILSVVTKVTEILRSEESAAYKIAYPENPDFNSPEYIQKLQDFYNKKDLATELV